MRSAMFHTLKIKAAGAELISVPTEAGIIIDKPCQLLVYLDSQHSKTAQ